jgi:hypothetical protein
VEPSADATNPAGITANPAANVANLSVDVEKPSADRANLGTGDGFVGNELDVIGEAMDLDW